jgi:Uma2 family endonuclease
MTQATTRPLSFNEFANLYPNNGKRYELINGQLVALIATKAHYNIADFIYDALRDEVKRTHALLKVTRFASLKTLRDDGLQQGRTPDVSVIDKALWNADLKAYTALEDPIQVAVEIASTNWRDDYLYKLAEYEALGIFEYWIVDYLALGAARYISALVHLKHRLFRSISSSERNISCGSFEVKRASIHLHFPHCG